MKSEKVVSKGRKAFRSILCVVFAMVTLAGCDGFSKQARLDKMKSYSNNPGDTPEQVKNEIKVMEEQFASLTGDKEKKESYNKITQWYKILGMRYLTIANNKSADSNYMKIEILPDYEDAYEAFVTAANRESDGVSAGLNKIDNSSNLWRLAGYCSVKSGSIIDEYKLSGRDASLYFKNGINCYNVAIQKDPKNLYALKELGTFYAINVRDGEKAVPLLEKTIQISTKDVDAMMTLGQAYYLARLSIPYNLKDDNRDYYQRAFDVYDKIIEICDSKDKSSSNSEIKRIIALAKENKTYMEAQLIKDSKK